MGRGLGRGVIVSSLACFKAAPHPGPLPARSSRGEGEEARAGCVAGVSQFAAEPREKRLWLRLTLMGHWPVPPGDPPDGTTEDALLMVMHSS